MSARRTNFYVDKQNRKWLGVCAGIADYTGIEVIWIRLAAIVLTFTGGFPWTLLAYWLVNWMAKPNPGDLYRGPEEARFWQGVRANPARSARDVRASFRDVDRRLADIELYYTSRNSRLADEIENLR